MAKKWMHTHLWNRAVQSIGEAKRRKGRTGIERSHNPMKEGICSSDVVIQQRLQKRLERLINATQLSLADRTLLQLHNGFLININNEAKFRPSTKTEVLGKARVTSYEDLEQVRKKRRMEQAEALAGKAQRRLKSMSKRKRADVGAEVVQCEHSRCGQEPNAPLDWLRDCGKRPGADVPESW
jgi:hypothetical protein